MVDAFVFLMLVMAIVGTTQGLNSHMTGVFRSESSTYQMLNPRNKLPGPLSRSPEPIWTYKAVPMVPPMPINCRCRDFNVRWVWSWVGFIEPPSIESIESPRLFGDASFSEISTFLLGVSAADSGSWKLDRGSVRWIMAAMGVWAMESDIASDGDKAEVRET